MRTESELENYFCDEIHEHGGATEKFCSPGKCGVPDRIVYWPRDDGPTVVDFVELKRPRGGRYSSLQDLDYAWRANLQLNVWRFHTECQIDEYIACRA